MSLTTSQLFLLSLIVGIGFYIWAYRIAARYRHQRVDMHSLPYYHGGYVFLWVFLPALSFLLLWTPVSLSILSQKIQVLVAEEHYPPQMTALVSNAVLNYTNGLTTTLPEKMKPIASGYLAVRNNLLTIRSVLVTLLLFTTGFIAIFRIKPHFRARNYVEKYLRFLMIFCAGIAVLTTFGILFSVLLESLRFFNKVPWTEFFFNTHWSPQIALREGQVGASGSFGLIPLLLGTLLISIIALLVAVPIGLFSAIYLSEYANSKVRTWAKPMLELLAGIPTVVYGFFAALTVAPFIRRIGEQMGLSVSSESALAAGVAMGIMIIPFISSLSDDIINAVPQSLREGSLGLGATKSETIKKVILPAALPGIISAVLLAASRAIGETMIVVMAAGQSANLTFNPLEAVTTVTVQIVTLLTGDTEFDSEKTLSAFALGLTLFVITFALNLFALHIVKKYREQYD